MRDSMAIYGQEWQVRIICKVSRYKNAPAKGEARRQKTDLHVSAKGNPVQQSVANIWKFWWQTISK